MTVETGVGTGIVVTVVGLLLKLLQAGVNAYVKQMSDVMEQQTAIVTAYVDQSAAQAKHIAESTKVLAEVVEGMQQLHRDHEAHSAALARVCTTARPPARERPDGRRKAVN